MQSFINSLPEEPVSKEIGVSYDAKINEAHRLGREEGMFLAKTMFKEPVSENLEEELKIWRHNHFHGRRDIDATGEYLERSSQLDIAIHFAQWKEKRVIEKVCEWIEETNRYFAPTNFNVENFKAYLKNYC